jgi:hypothetical protein
MTSVFVVCAAVGATVLVLQFLLGLVGLGGGDLAADAPHDFGHDLGGGDHDLAGDDVHGDDLHDASHPDGHHTSFWLFRALSLRTIVAALAFFGLSGLAAQAAECEPWQTLLIAIGAGLAAMYAVYWLLCAAKMLRAEGTAKIQRAVGKEATVYLRVPGHQKGSGKIQINLQNRTMEYLATTPGDAIPTGAKVIVVGIVGADTVQVLVPTTSPNVRQAFQPDK